MEQMLAMHHLAFSKTKYPHSAANFIRELPQLLLKFGPVYIGITVLLPYPSKGYCLNTESLFLANLPINLSNQ